MIQKLEVTLRGGSLSNICDTQRGKASDVGTSSEDDPADPWPVAQDRSQMGDDGIPGARESGGAPPTGSKVAQVCGPGQAVCVGSWQV